MNTNAKILTALVAVVAIIALTGVFHILVLAAIGAALFGIGYGAGKRLSSTQRRHLK